MTECSLCLMRNHVILIIETPLHRSPRFTTPFSVPPDCAVNQDFTLYELESYLGMSLQIETQSG